MSREGHWGEIPSPVRTHDCKRQAVRQSVVLQEEKAFCMTKTLLGRWWRVRRSKVKAEKSGIRFVLQQVPMGTKNEKGAKMGVAGEKGSLCMENFKGKKNVRPRLRSTDETGNNTEAGTALGCV